MTTPADPAAPDPPPPSDSLELGGLDAHQLLKIGLDTVVMPQGLDPDPDATIAAAGPRPSQPAAQVELPLPEALTQLLPAGAYKVESFLGQGGMGAVYKGVQIRLKRPVAIKIMRRDVGRDHDFEARFEREAQAMAKLNHPNIVSVIDFGEAGPDYLYIVMELIDGADMMDVIRGGQMTQEMALSLLPQICDALQFAHDHGIVHRDIKPSNIMLTRDGRIKMADFGLAKHFDAESSFRTQTGTGMGTPDYAAPEQFDPSAQIDHRADIYALGVMIYQMITGQLPRGVWKAPSQRSECAPQWDSIVSRAMQSDPSDRYQQASEVKTDVSSISLAGKEGSAGTPARPSSKDGAAAKTQEAVRSDRAPIKSRAPLLVGLITGAAVIAIAAFFALRNGDEGRADGPPAAANVPGRTTPEKAPATPNAALPGASALPIAAAPLPESGWKPLFTEEEWRTSKGSEREFEDGLVHLRGGGWRKPQPSPDGAIRARIQLRADSRGAALAMRHRDEKGYYSLGAASDGKSVYLDRFDSPSKSTKLASYWLPKPPQPGDTITLELRIRGDHLTAIVNGKVIGEVTDAQIKGPDEWGVGAANGWFESVEVQSLDAPAVAMAPPLPESGWKPLFTDAEWKAKRSEGETVYRGTKVKWSREFKEGLQHLVKFGLKQPQPAPDGAIRAQIVIREGSNLASVSARNSADQGRYQMATAPDFKTLSLTYTSPKDSPSVLLGQYKLPKPSQIGDKLLIELRLQGDQLTGLLNGVAVIEAQDQRIASAGDWGIDAGDGWFESVEVQSLAAPALAMAPPLPESGWKPLVTEKEWQSNWDGGETENQGKKWRARREFQDGLLHLSNTFVRKKQPFSDGAVRAALVVREGFASWVSGRALVGHGNYRFGLQDAKTLQLAFAPNGPPEVLGTYTLAESLKPGDKAAIELRIQGDRLTGLFGGAVVIEARDSHLTAAGEWGIDGGGWFESVEVQSLPAAVAAIKLWDSPEKLPKNPGVTWENGAMRIDSGSVDQLSPRTRDAIARVSVRMNPDSKRPELWLRKQSAINTGYKVGLDVQDRRVALKSANNGIETILMRWQLPRSYAPDEWLKLEFRAVGDSLTVSVDGTVLGTVHDTSRSQPGNMMLYAEANGFFRDIEYAPLDKQPTASPSPSLPVSKSSDPKFPPGQWVKLFTKAEDLPADLRKPDSGVKFEDGWIRFGNGDRNLNLPLGEIRNVAVRVSSRRRGAVDNTTNIILRSNIHGTRYQLGLKKDGTTFAAQKQEQGN